jgi:N-acetylmuramoyl-L-alanine amidase
MRTIDSVIVHCSDTPAGRHTTVDEIRSWHLERGWEDIGYHYVIYLDGTVHTGRPENIPGAHCKGKNSKSIGVCYIGGKDNVDTRTEEQREALVDLLVYLKTTYPKVRIYGHRDFSDKYCPSFDATKEYENISNMWE